MTSSWKSDLILALAFVAAVASLAFGCGGCVQKQSDDEREIAVEMIRAGRTGAEIECFIRANNRR